VIAGYTLAMVGMGCWLKRRDSDMEDYLLGGRSIPWWLAGVSYLMTLVSTLSMVALPGEAYANGITLAIQNLILPPIALAAIDGAGNKSYVQERLGCMPFLTVPSAQPPLDSWFRDGNTLGLASLD